MAILIVEKPLLYPLAKMYRLPFAAAGSKPQIHCLHSNCEYFPAHSPEYLVQRLPGKVHAALLATKSALNGVIISLSRCSVPKSPRRSGSMSSLVLAAVA